MAALTTNGVTKTSTTSAGNDAIRPKTGDTVYCHYIGTLKSNGQKFDSSRDKRRAFTFQVGIGQGIKTFFFFFFFFFSRRRSSSSLSLSLVVVVLLLGS